MLGPAIGTLHSAVLRPVVEDADARLEENGELPAPPESLRQYEGLDLKVDFMSPLAEAQERLVYQGVDAFLATMQALAQPGMFGPDILDHVNDRELVEALSNRDSVPPMFLNTKDDVMRLRQEKAARLAAQQQTEQEMQGAETLNKLSKAPEEGSPAEALLGG